MTRAELLALDPHPIWQYVVWGARALAARDHLAKQPTFAIQSALAALHWMSMGHGYELKDFDAHEAHRLAIEAAGYAQQSAKAQAAIEQVLAGDRPMSASLRRALDVATSAPAPRRN
jgi:hypothetical protein